MPALGPSVSVLLPAHDRADVLPFAVASVLAQDEGDFELLLVSDGCTDGSLEWARTVEDPRLRLFDLPKAPGFGYANRNVALREARGGLVAYMQHDDLWLPDHLSRMARLFDDPSVVFAYSRPLWVERDGTAIPATLHLGDRSAREAFVSYRRQAIPSCAVVHRRACFDRVGLWDETRPHWGDWELWIRILTSYGHEAVAYEKEPTSLHFRALWKAPADELPRELLVWRELHARRLAPEGLSFPVMTGEPEQEAVWRLLAAAPDRFSRRLRAAVTIALDSFADRMEQLLRERDGAA